MTHLSAKAESKVQRGRDKVG